jgi:carbamoyl-phosphate synthase large subunit
VFITVNDADKASATPIARKFYEMGFDVYATPGTARYFRAHGIQAREVFKVHEGRPHGIDLIVNGQVQLLINTPLGKHAQRDDYSLRQAAIANRVSYTTTLSAADAALEAILSLKSRTPTIRSLQEWHEDLRVWRAEGGTRDRAPIATPVSLTAVR